MISWPPKDPDEFLDYDVDWTDLLAPDVDAIATSEFLVEAGDVVIADDPAPSVTGSVTKVWLSGGTLGNTARILNRITTTGGRIWDQTMRLRIRSR